MPRLEVIQPGALSLLQDLGRRGFGHLGVSQGGPVDLYAHCWANRLVGNPSTAATLEITLGQANFRAADDLALALAGADMSATIDGKKFPAWQAVLLRKGQTLKLEFASSGLRAYLAVSGGFRAPPVFGSVATVVRNRLGGLARDGAAFGNGTPLRAGDLLEAATAPSATTAFHSTPTRFIPDYRQAIDLGLIESSQADSFGDDEKAKLYGSEYAIGNQSDRMGCRLVGPPVKSQLNGIISEGIALGAVQIPADGQPIVLLNDRQTLGGYPKIGGVARLDLPRLAQAKPGDKVRFHRADLVEQRQKWGEFARFFGVW